jgi:hypothetical protein
MLDDTLLLFDARLLSVDHRNRLATFDAGGVAYTGRLPYPAHWAPGTIGLLALSRENETFVFQSYPDQRLRRATEHDWPNQDEWGWAIEDHRFTVKRGIVPGLSGAVVRDDCQPLELRIPPEFLSFCQHLGLPPEDLLRTFIADSCALIDSRRRPREDRYCSTGVHERFLAREYCLRLCVALPTVSPMHSVPGGATARVTRDA